MRSASHTVQWTGPPEEPQSWGTKGAGPSAVGFPRKPRAAPSLPYARPLRPRAAATTTELCVLPADHGPWPAALGPAPWVAHVETAGAHPREPGLPHGSSPPLLLPAGPGTAPSARKPRAGETAAGGLCDGTQSPCVFASTHRTWSRPGGLGSGGSGQGQPRTRAFHGDLAAR